MERKRIYYHFYLQVHYSTLDMPSSAISNISFWISSFTLLFDDIFDLVNANLILLPLPRLSFCNNPNACKLSLMSLNCTRHIHLSFPFCFHSIFLNLHPIYRHRFFSSYYWEGLIIVRYKVSEGGLKGFFLELEALETLETLFFADLFE